jgi:hypothetical protein
LDVLKYEIDYAFLAEGLFEFYDAGVFQHLEDFHFPHGGLFNDLILL